jgi:hypothetical protein
MIYAFALIDRVNLGAANTAGMGEDLVGGLSFCLLKVTLTILATAT